MNIKHISLFAAPLAALSLTLSVSGQAQNLVPNPSFEQVSEDAKEKDIKSFGLINVFSEEWGGATEVAPDLFMEREKEIVLTKVPDITENLADQVARVVRSIRQIELKKHPSVSETLDWAKTLVLLGVEKIDEQTAASTINILLKYQSDINKALKELATADGVTP